MQSGPMIRRLGQHWLEHRWQEGIVYFVAETSGKPRLIKIGWTQRNPRARLSQLQVGNAKRLELLGCLPGPREKEAEFHGRFAYAAVGGEWFRPVSDLLDEIEWVVDPPRELRGEPGEFDAAPVDCAWCQQWRLLAA